MSQTRMRHFVSEMRLHPPDMDEWLMRAADEVEIQSGHRLSVAQGWQVDQDAYYVRLTCRKCQTIWQRAWAAQTLRRCGALHSRIWFIDSVVPLFAWIMEAECWPLEEKQGLAEYVTERLVEAGPEGMSISQLIRALVEDAGAPPGNVTRGIDALGFETRDGMIWLPPGHPLREW